MKIKEVIVVEGKNDTNKLKSYFDCDTIETHGTCLSDFTISLIKRLNETRGVIVFCDPDSPGDYIRNKLNEKIPGLKHAFILKEDGRTDKKVGIEHASKSVLEKALKNVVTYKEIQSNISMEDMFELGLCGSSNSSAKRDIVSKHFNLGKANCKTLLKRINMLGLTINQIKEVL